MQERYEEAIRETFKYLDDYISSPDNILSSSYAEAIKAHMKTLGFLVYCGVYTNHDDMVVVYPMQDNLSIHIWRRK